MLPDLVPCFITSSNLDSMLRFELDFRFRIERLEGLRTNV